MSRNNNNINRGQIRIDKSAVIAYDDSDPRYNLNIEDSDEYTKNIYPLHFSKRCHDSKEYENMVKYDHPLVSRCWGERYEHCAAMKKYGGKKYGDTCNSANGSNDGNSNDPIVGRSVIDTGYCSCAECAMNLYGPIEDTLGYARIDLTPDENKGNEEDDPNELNRSDFKRQNESTIYDRTRIFKNDGLHINRREPDVKPCGSSMSVNKAGNSLEDNLELEDRYAHHKLGSNLEGFGGAIGSIGSGIGGGLGDSFGGSFSAFGDSFSGSFESSLGVCPPIIGDNFGYSTLCCFILGFVICCCVSQAFVSGSPVMLKMAAPQVLIAASVLICVCGCSTYSFFKDTIDNWGSESKK
jgi:hypothetical protein